MTPQPGSSYRLNTGHTVTCTSVGAKVAQYVLPVTGQTITLGLSPQDPDAVRVIGTL